MALKINKDIIDEVYNHGRKDLPNEACGYLAGSQGEVKVYHQMTNVDKASDHFTLDPHEQFSAMKLFREQGLDILAVCHTHPQTPARPSVEDIKLAYDPNVLYVIMSLIDDSKTIKAFKIVKDQVSEEEITIGE